MTKRTHASSLKLTSRNDFLQCIMCTKTSDHEYVQYLFWLLGGFCVSHGCISRVCVKVSTYFVVIKLTLPGGINIFRREFRYLFSTRY